jgi:hypothetical protein
LSCKGIDKLISLFLDGRLNESQRRKLEEHLSRCKSCKGKLSFLQSIQQKAKGIKAQEPPEEYWNTFSSRVREKLIARQEKPAFGWKQVLENVFSFSPLKVKIAAGVISVVFVFVVGKLYLEHRGEHIAPPQELAQMRQEPKSDHIQEELGNKPSPTGESGKQAAPAVVAKPGAEKKPADERGKEPPPSQIAGEEKPVSQKGREILSPPPVRDEEAPSTAVPSAQTPSTVKAEAEEGAVVSESKSAGAGADQRAQKKAEIVAIPEETGALKGGDSAQENRLQEILSTQVGFVSPQTSSRIVSLPTNGGPPITKIGEADTLVQADTLREVIAVWRAYVKEHPTDSLSREGYLQIATAYYLLARAGQDTSQISEGVNLIRQYLDQVQDPAVKRELGRKLKQIQALRQK